MWGWEFGRGTCEDTPAVGAPYLAVHQQPDGEGDIEAAFRDLGLHFLPGAGRHVLAGRAAPAKAAPWLDHLGTQRGRLVLRRGSSGWDRPHRAAKKQLWVRAVDQQPGQGPVATVGL